MLCGWEIFLSVKCVKTAVVDVNHMGQIWYYIIAMS